MSDVQADKVEKLVLGSDESLSAGDQIVAKPITHDRLTVITKVYHEQPNEQPTGCEPVPFVKTLETSEQPYGPRKGKVGIVPIKLDLGWVKDPGLVLIENIEGRGLQSNLNEDQKKALAERIIYFAMIDQPKVCLVIHPGAQLPVWPNNHHDWCLWSSCEDVKFRISVFPR